MTVTPEQWVEALESGDWEPAQGQLVAWADVPDGEEVMGHCCLGVLARLSGYTDGQIVNHGGTMWPGMECVILTNEWEEYDDDDAPPVGPPEWLTPQLAEKYATLNDEHGTYPIGAIREDLINNKEQS